MRSLSNKLIIVLLAAFVTLVVGAYTLAYFSARQALLAQFDRKLLNQIKLITQVIEQRNEDLRVHDHLLSYRSGTDDFAAATGSSAFQVWDWNQETARRSQSLGGESLPLRHGAIGELVSWNLDLKDGRRFRAMGIHFMLRLDEFHDPDFPRKEAFLVVASDRTEVSAAVNRQGYLLLAAGLGSLGVLGMLTPFIVRRGLRSLGELTRQAEEIHTLKTHERFHTENTSTELVPIYACLNRLLDRLEKSFDRERRFSADVAHELLTPLSELRSLAEFALRFPDSNPRLCIEQSLEILLRVEKIVISLLDLCSAEQQDDLLAQTVPVALLPCLQTQLQPLTERAVERDLQVNLVVSETAEIMADPVRTGLIFSNILGNAFEYADPASVITIRWEQNDDSFRITVSNKASTLRAEDIPHLFDRFWRLDASRTESSHSGIGLPLSRELAHTMGMSLEATLADQGFLHTVLSGPFALKRR